MAITVQGQDSTKQEAICSWKLCYSEQFFSPFELHLYNKTLLGIIVNSSQKTIKLDLNLPKWPTVTEKACTKKLHMSGKH